MITKGVFVLGVSAFAVGCATATATAAGVFTLKSTTFADGKMMPKKVANTKQNGNNNPNCVGDNVSPQFSWSNVPDGTKSFVFLNDRPRRPWRRWRQSLGRLRNTCIRYRLCRRRSEQTDRQICRRQKHPRGRVLFRPVHAAQSNGASLYIRSNSYRSCAD